MDKDDSDDAKRRRKKDCSHSKKRRDRSPDSDEDSRRKRKRRDKKKNKHKDKKRKKRKSRSDSSSSASSSDDSKRRQQVNTKLLAKLQARGETLEERQARRAEKRAAVIATKFGYTADDNPFNDPQLHQKFTWGKKQQQSSATSTTRRQENTFDEIEKVRRRRTDRELQFAEMERIRAEESRMKELENYDDWARKEEEFHLQQQRKRSAIRLVEGRERPVDVLAKNVLMFGLSEEEKKDRVKVKYQEKYDAMDALENLDAELDEPHQMMKMLKRDELETLCVDIDSFRTLEREAAGGIRALSGESNPVLEYWNAVALVANDEIKLLQTGGAEGSHAKVVKEVTKIFEGHGAAELEKMKVEVTKKIRDNAHDLGFDRNYWSSVLEQLDVQLAKLFLSRLHEKMLVRQLERLEKKMGDLASQPQDKAEAPSKHPEEVQPEQGDLEEELGLTDEVTFEHRTYNWQDKYRPRKPRYFNRVKTGYDWNKYNQTHYDKDNPPPKVVQGYKFNIFYSDLIDPTKTPQFKLEPADSPDFCLLRFTASAPYEDLAFKIVNREWARSRKKGYKCVFDRGVLSLYFSFTTHWYRR